MTIAVDKSFLAFENNENAEEQQVARFEYSEEDPTKVEAYELRPIKRPNAYFGLATDGKSVFLCGGYAHRGQ